MAHSTAKQDKSGRDKMLAVGAVVLIVLAALAIYKVYSNSQVHVAHQINLPVGSSEKMQAMHNKGESVSDDIDVHHLTPSNK